jgi:hypothetical protein
MLLVNPGERINYQQICTKLKRLRENCESGEYALELSPFRESNHHSFGDLLRPSAISLLKDACLCTCHLRPLQSWKFEVDNEFAGSVLEHVKPREVLKRQVKRNRLCNRCAELNFWSSGFAIEDDTEALAKSAANCDFCKLLHSASLSTDDLHSQRVRFERTQSVITMKGNTFPVFRSCEAQVSQQPIHA